MNTQQIPNEGISETHNSWMKCSWLWLSGRWGLLQSRAQPSQHSVASREWPSVGLQATQFGLLPLGWGLVEFIFFHQQIFIEHPLWNRRWPECLPRSWETMRVFRPFHSLSGPWQVLGHPWQPPVHSGLRPGEAEGLRPPRQTLKSTSGFLVLVSWHIILAFLSPCTQGPWDRVSLGQEVEMES